MSLGARDKQVVWHPFTKQMDMPEPIGIVRGKDTLLFDDNGNAYIDAISSWWVTLHGHGNTYIAERLYQQALQLEQVIFAGFTHAPAVELAEQLLQVLPPHFSRIFYSDNGSTSIEVALKMAVQYWWNRQEVAPKRVTLLAFNNAYHGDTFGAMSVSDRSVFTLAFHDLLFEVLFIDTPTADNLETLYKTINGRANEIAAFIYEPLVQGAGGMHMYAPEHMNALLAHVQSHNILCIADEVMTGFGRTGKLFASAYMQQQPDIICLSKGLTGGTMALGVTACSNKIYEAFVSNDSLKTFFHGHSFTANPLACTAALASLHLMQQNNSLQAIDHIHQQHKVFEATLQTQKGIRQIRVLGTILAFEVAQGKNEYLNTIAVTITQLAMEQGIYIRPLGNTVYLMPPYCITDEELQTCYRVILNILNRICE